MLILTRKLGESIVIGNDIRITVERINKNHIKLGLNAPNDVTICREEVFGRIKDENALSSASSVINHIKG